MFRLKTAVSWVFANLVNSSFETTSRSCFLFFHISLVKPLPSLIWIVTASYNLLLPPFPTTVYSQPSNQSDPAKHQQTLSLLSCALHSPQVACVCGGPTSSVATACHSTPVPCTPASGLFVFCLLPQDLSTCCALCPRHFSQESHGSLTSFSHPSVKPSQTTYPLVPFLAFLISLPCFIFFHGYILVCFYFPHQNVSSVRGQELCFGHRCTPDTEKSAWHISKARE